MTKKIGIMIAVALIFASIAVSSALACTTLTPGYWKNHRSAWPSGVIFVGADPYNLGDSGDVDDLMEILWADKGRRKNDLTPDEQAWIILAQKVIAAQLSMLKYPHPSWSNPGSFGGYPNGMVGMVDDANALLAGPGTRTAMLDLAEIMDDWLNIWNEHGLNG